jgi:hypothetical protein
MASMVEARHAYQTLLGKSLGKCTLGGQEEVNE